MKDDRKARKLKTRPRVETGSEGTEDRLRRLSLAFAEIVDPIIVEDLSGIVVHLNSEAERVFGWSRQELIGRPFKSIIPEKLHDRTDRLRARCRDGEIIRDIEGTRPTKTGENAHVLVTLSLLTDESGAPIGIASMSKDITKWKVAEIELENSRARFAGILDNAVEAIISMDESGCVTMFNGSAESMFGYSSDEAIGQPLEFLLPERFRGAHGNHVNGFTHSSEVSRHMGERGDIFGRRKDGTEFPAEASISKLHSGGRTVFTAMVTDITEPKQAEEDLRLRNQELETLANIGNIFAGPALFSEKLRSVANQLASLVEADWVTLRQSDVTAGISQLVMSEGPKSPLVHPIRIISDEEALALVVPLHNEIVIINDCKSDPRVLSAAVECGINSLVCVPVNKERGSMSGVLTAMSRKPHHFDVNRVRILTALSDEVGYMVANHQLREEIEVSNQVARIFTSTIEPEKVFDQFAAALRSLVPFDHIVIVLPVGERDSIEIVYVVSDAVTPFYKGQIFHMGDTYISQAMIERRAVISGDIAGDVDYSSKERLLQSGLNSVIAVPLESNQAVIGGLSICSKIPGAFGPRDQAILERLAGHIAPAAENARLYEQAKSELALRVQTETRLRSRTRELDVLVNFARILTSRATLQSKCESIVQELSDSLLDDHQVILWMPKDEGKGLQLKASSGAQILQVSDATGALLETNESGEQLNLGIPILSSDSGPQPLEISSTYLEIPWESFYLPVRFSDETLGVVQVVSRELHHFTTERQQFLEAASGGLGVMLANARLQESERLRNQELNTLLDIAQTANQTGVLQEKCERIVGKLRTVAGVDAVTLRFANYEAGGLDLIAWVNSLEIQPVGTIEYEASPLYKEASEGRPVVINDYAKDPHADADSVKHGVGSLLVIPLSTPDGIEGVLTLGSAQAFYFTPEAVRFLSAIGEELGALLQNAQLDEKIRIELEERQRVEEELTNRTEQLETLLKFAEAVTGQGTFESKMTRVLDDIKRITQSDVITLRIPDPQTDELVLTGHSETVMQVDLGEMSADKRGVSGECIASGKVVLKNDYASYPEAFQQYLDAGTNSAIAVPIKIEGQTVAVIVGGSFQRNHFTRARVDTIIRLGEGIGIMLENVRLNQALMVKEELESRRDAFVSVVSHELRTPMTSIMGFSDLLLARGPTPKRRREWLGYINRESKRLTAILDELLDISRIQSGNYIVNSEPVSLSDALNEAVAFARSFSERHRITVDIAEDLPLLIADREKLGQVMANLLTNAVNYSPEGGEVQVAAAVAAESHRALITVSDNGVGIAQDDVKDLFTIFHRIRRPETESIKGTGLGLYIVREMMELMGGEVWVESELGKGTTFFVSLPIDEPANHTVRPAAKGENDS